MAGEPEVKIPTPDDNNIDYISLIEELKNNTVKKEDYDKLKQDHTRLLQSIINGENIDIDIDADGKPESETPEELNTRISALRKELFNSQDGDMTNLDFISKTMQLREALIKKGEQDIFLPSGKNITPSEEDIKSAQRVADVYQQCIDYAKGDPIVFTNELQRRTLNSMPNRR